MTDRALPATTARSSKREAILDAALEIFGARGSSAGTLAEVAEKVGITRAGVLHHFGSKEALLREVLAHRDRLSPHPPESESDDALFLHLVRTAAENQQRPGIVQAYTVLSAEAVTDGNPGRAFFRDRYAELAEQIARALGRLCRSRGVEPPETVGTAASAIIAVMDGLQLQWLLRPDSVELAAATDFAIRAIVDEVLRAGDSVRPEHDRG